MNVLASVLGMRVERFINLIIYTKTDRSDGQAVTRSFLELEV